MLIILLQNHHKSVEIYFNHCYLDIISLNSRVHDTDQKESNGRRTVSICSISDQIGDKTEAGFGHRRPRRRLSISSLAAPSKV